MGDQDSATSLPPSSSTIAGNSTELPIPASLKFLISNVKNLIPHPLTVDNYAIWRIQIIQHFTANGYTGHLTSKTPPPSAEISQEHHRWLLVDSNLISALFPTIYPHILPHVINSSTAHNVWTILERRLQPTSRSRVIQLKNELHHIQMKDLSMQQYLSQIKNIVDNIAASDSQVDRKNVVLYILNGLPSSYNSFKTTIRTSSLPANLDNLYSLLCSEEIHVQQELIKDSSNSSLATALQASIPSQNRWRSQKRFAKNFNNNTRQPALTQTPPALTATSTNRPVCQI
ncbi:hypothetical protein KFK09_021433 [Dendrobium nobile]|uniref:Retrovirus-related Pol polyprotein from transposon TNT 1-94 n=1 Tax=Dendrobium nobile TaxID=94219 RepID=A0A8T3AR51_DENNO|nr:hypothetical protein KFK09_021433 [Dendrobium nobile]